MDQSQAATQKHSVVLKPNYSLDTYTPSPSNDLAGTQMPARTLPREANELLCNKNQ